MGKRRSSRSSSWFLAALATLLAPSAALAQDSDVAAGERLYIGQCKICHGALTETAASQARARPPVGFNQLALGPSPQHAASDAAPVLLAFAPPFGPTLRGVYGRPAGSVAGFDYSATFMAKLKGMEWNEAALDVWITSPQAWVPGVYMYYKQPDADVRRKIIAYLKANP